MPSCQILIESLGFFLLMYKNQSLDDFIRMRLAVPLVEANVQSCWLGGDNRLSRLKMWGGAAWLSGLGKKQAVRKSAKFKVSYGRSSY